MKILFLHGLHSTSGGIKPTYLAQHGHSVLNPKLDDDIFAEAVRIAQAEYDRHRPNVIVGSSRGGAVAMNIDSKETPLVLLCPAWKNWGTATTVKEKTTILHSSDDDTIPFEDSEELIRNSNLPETTMILTGHDHRLADPESLERILDACWDDRYHAIHEVSHAVVGLRSGLTPKRLSIGRTTTGTSGGIEFCSNAALKRDSWRYLLIAVAGCVGTRLFGYGNALVSEKLKRLSLQGEIEPGWQSDEWLVWEGEYPIPEIEQAEKDAQAVLEDGQEVVSRLSDALLANRVLEKKAIQAIFQKRRSKS